MIKLEDFLYGGHTIFSVLQSYTDCLEDSALENKNQIDLVHCDFLNAIFEILEHNEFLTSQSQRIREFYKYMVNEYPYLAFTFKGRIKSIIRAEEKFNRYIVDYIYEYYIKYGRYPEVAAIKGQLDCFRDLIAYRIVISVPKCHMGRQASEEDLANEEKKILYEIANEMPKMLSKLDFTLIKANLEGRDTSELLDEEYREYYRDYVEKPSKSGYQSLHLTLYDNLARCYIEVQLRTKDMDDFAEIGPANHLGYEKNQEQNKSKRDAIPVGECLYFDEAYERVKSLERLDLSKIDVNMFKAVDNSLINDGCGLFRGRQILPFEHLSRYQKE